MTIPSARLIPLLLLLAPLLACGSNADGDPSATEAATVEVSTTADPQAAPTTTTLRHWPRPATIKRADPAIFDVELSTEPTYEVVDTRDYRGVEMQRISFESPMGGLAYGWLSLPVGDPVPGIGILRAHGAPVDGTDEFIPMAMMACAGVPSIVVDAPYARPGANRSGEALLFTPADRDEQIQLVVDMRRAVDILATLGAERFGFGGISYGAAIGGQLIGVEPRIEVAVMILGDGGLIERFFGEDGEPMWPVAGMDPAEIEPWREAMLPIEPMLYIGDSTADILFMNGTRDPIIPPAEAERYHAAAPAGSEVYWMDIDHDIPFEDMKNIHNHWFGERLGIDLDRLDSCTAELFPNGWDDL